MKIISRGIFAVASLMTLLPTQACAKQPPESPRTPVPQTVADSARTRGVREFFPYFVYAIADQEAGARTREISKEQFYDALASEVASAGLNTLWLNNLEMERLPDWLAAGCRHGLRIIPEGSGPATFSLIYEENATLDDWRRNAEEIRAFYREDMPRYRNDTTLLAYIIMEEPPADPAKFEIVRSIVEEGRRIDPDHPMLVEVMWDDAVKLAAEHLRPPAISKGVGPFQTTNTDDDARYYIPLDIERSYQAARARDAHLWVLVQGNDMEAYQDGRRLPRDPSRPGSRRPTPAQLRWQVWTSLLHGAKGIGYFLWSWPYEIPGEGYHEDMNGLAGRDGGSTELVAEVRSIGAAILPLGELILRLESVDDWSAEEHPNWSRPMSDVRARSFLDRTNNARYVIVVNNDFDSPRPAALPNDVTGERWTDLRTAKVYDATDIGSLQLRPGDGTVLRAER